MQTVSTGLPAAMPKQLPVLATTAGLKARAWQLKLTPPCSMRPAGFSQRYSRSCHVELCTWAAGTTTATVLTRAIFAEGCKSVAAGMNPMDLRRGINAAVEAVVGNLKSRATMISTTSEIAQVLEQLIFALCAVAQLAQLQLCPLQPACPLHPADQLCTASNSTAQLYSCTTSLDDSTARRVLAAAGGHHLCQRRAGDRGAHSPRNGARGQGGCHHGVCESHCATVEMKRQQTALQLEQEQSIKHAMHCKSEQQQMLSADACLLSGQAGMPA